MSADRDLSAMGATLLDNGVLFRVWAPHASAVSVVGDFNSWDATTDEMAPEGNGNWSAAVKGAKAGDEYKFALDTPAGTLLRIDPYAREVTGSAGNAVVLNPDFAWNDANFSAPPLNEMVIYELHVGTFSDELGTDGAGQFASMSHRLGYLKSLGINAIQIMPVAEFAGERSWGYNPSHIFSVEQGYGGSRGLKRFVDRAHAAGIAVILDVVYNHLGPSDLDLWQFDGWSENEQGGVYFYNDGRAQTPWGQTRPDYGRPEVRQFIGDNVLMWLGEYHIDGLRFDGTQFIRGLDGSGQPELPDGWSLLQSLHVEIAERFPGRFTIAEDLQNNHAMVRSVGQGGAGFDAQWDAQFVHPIRRAVTATMDGQRSLAEIEGAISYQYNDNAFGRVIYSESHDEVANGRSRVPQEVDPQNPTSWLAQKRSTLAAGLVMTAAGIPMLFQGQEFLQGDWFKDTVPLDWAQGDEFPGIQRLYRDLIRLRLNSEGVSGGLCGRSTDVYHSDDSNKIIAFHRWGEGGPGDDVVVVANFSNEQREGYVIGWPAEGPWQLRFDSDEQGYSEDFAGYPSTGVVAELGEYDSQPCRGALAIGPYSLLMFSQN